MNCKIIDEQSTICLIGTKVYDLVQIADESQQSNENESGLYHCGIS